ncbi:MAG: diacylglucosamine hydrolase like protein [Sulfurovum sp. AS07-7]|nr:MAG: diacylglucosamine hydrolase like protein [Sulfurovum sp. AS07-7]
MLVHICCAVDSHYFLQKLRDDYPNEKLIGFFYDPNIHPYSEYYLRLLDVKRSCKLLNIELIEGEYDTQSWLEAVKGYENEPEKGKRCSICFDNRFETSAAKAKELGMKIFTSTLLTSPKKSLAQLKTSGEFLAKKYGIEFIAPDYRSKQGTQEQNILAKQDKLYRQDYCGCLFGLTKQREYQDRLADELFSPMSNQIMPESIESRIQLYEKRWELEDKGISYAIRKERFLNYRLLLAKVTQNNHTIPSHFLPYSTLKKGYSRGKITWDENMGYFDRDEIIFISLDFYNKLANTEYKTVKELIFNPPIFEEEIKIREQIFSNPYNLSAIIVINNKLNGKFEIICDSKVYEDVKENLIF